MPHRHLATAGAGTPTSPDPEDNAQDCKLSLIYQNTYQLGSKQPWVERSVRAILKEVMHEHLDTAEYDYKKCADLAVAVSNEVRSRVQELNFDRYKICCIVEIFEKRFQGVHSKARLLWDVHRDRFISYKVSNTHIMAIGTVFGVYYE